MKKYLYIVPIILLGLFLFPKVSLGTGAFNSASGSSKANSGSYYGGSEFGSGCQNTNYFYNSSPATCSFNNGSGTIMVVSTWNDVGASSSVSSITYNGVNLTKLKEIGDANERNIDMWYLLNPATSTHNVVATFTGGVLGLDIATYTGFGSFGTPTSSLANSVTSITTHIATTSASSWYVGAYTNGSVDNFATSTTASTDKLRSWQGSNSHGVWIFDSNGIPTTSTSTYKQVNNASGNFRQIMVEMIPSGPNPPSIGFTNLVNSSTISDFNNWTVDLSNFGSNVHACVNYDFNSSSSFAYQDCSDWRVPYVITGFQIPKLQALWFPPLLNNPTWYAQASLASPTGTIVATSSVVQFVVNTGSPVTTSSQPFFTSSISTSTVFALLDCSAYQITLFSSSTLGGIQCVATNWLYTALNTVLNVPQYIASTITSAYTGFQNAIVQVFPVNVFVAVNNSFKSVQSTSTDVQMVFTGTGNAYKKVGGGYYSFTFLTSSTPSWLATYGFDYKMWIDNFIYLLTAVIIIYESARFIKSLHKHQKK